MFVTDRGVAAMGGEWCGRPGCQSLKGGKMGIKTNILNEKIVTFRAQKF
jgi:hypothetical protein